MKSILKVNALLKTSVIFLFLNIILQSPVDAQLQFKVDEIMELFQHNDTEIFSFLLSKGYSYKGQESGFMKYTKHTFLGDYKLTLKLSKSKLQTIKYQELVARGSIFIQDLDNNSFSFSKNNTDEDSQGLYVGCTYQFENNQARLLCTVIRSPDQENVLSIVFGKTLNQKSDQQFNNTPLQTTKPKIVMPSRKNF